MMTESNPGATVTTRLEQRVEWLERALLRAHYNATHDQLTCLLNRGLFTDRLEQAILQARRQHRQVGLLFLDLDGFKEVNDHFGHQVGDELLTQVAQRLVECTRDADTVGRFGGDEFMLLIPEVESESDVADLACKLNQRLGEPYLVDGKVMTLTATIGAAIYPEDSAEQEGLIRCADIAMYAAREGNSSFRIFQHVLL